MHVVHDVCRGIHVVSMNSGACKRHEMLEGVTPNALYGAVRAFHTSVLPYVVSYPVT